MKILAFKNRTKVALYINLEHRDIDMWSGTEKLLQWTYKFDVDFKN
jgi:hypothetical protein